MLDRDSLFYRLMLYIIGFLLFCEWLRPLEVISNTDDVRIFFIYATFCFFVSFLQVPWYLSVPLKGLSLAFIIDGLYIGERIFSGDWFSVLYGQILFNIQMIQSQEWWQMTPLFRSLLFLILLWLMSYLLYYWFVVARRMFFFVLLTLIFVTVVDTFTVYDGKWAIVRTFILGMMALGLSSFAKEMEKESISIDGFHKAKVWAVPLLAIILLSSAAAYASPKLSPQWPDPVPYLESAAGGSGPGGSGRTVQKVGYGEDDSRLGGSFIQDDTPVFEAMADGDRYWRIESKDTYTGKGWEDTLEEPVTNMNPADITFETFSDEVEVEEQTAMIMMKRNASFRKLVYPYGITSIKGYPQNYDLLVHENTGEMDTVSAGNGDPARLGSSIISYEFPSFEYNQLREAGADDPQEIQEKYLQLPQQLPGRVQNLAGEIMEGEDNRYDKAKAVESYFSANGFEYSTTEVPVPGENQDYVDQFLFESQIGYCDNFSTSMVVLLRSEGIPARWVKGFTGGERVDTRETFSGDNVQNVYEVTSGNAHSWVEVYFPDIGWVPFEPTQGFTNNADFYTDVDTPENEDETTGTENQQPEDNMGNPQQMEEEEQTSGSTDVRDTNNVNWTWVWITLAVLSAIALGLYFTRFRWMSTLLIYRYRKNKDEKTYEKAYHFLLKLLDHRGIKRQPEQTLRDYAIKVDKHYQSTEMRRLTHNYERVIYRNESQQSQWPEVTELWENLIKKTLS
ncbi:DUF4129 domain-containing transglutaminase family protein [Halobacillus litoralis]|uniref:DUF4129 domain-containing transglutaminase family protein n=1 Tax=Halobacillus litoralis TaxID=45668 RepID=UPI001CFE039B|nr:transglutaminase domain-containing protein [Halobacillus litoralis]